MNHQRIRWILSITAIMMISMLGIGSTAAQGTPVLTIPEDFWYYDESPRYITVAPNLSLTGVTVINSATVTVIENYHPEEGKEDYLSFNGNTNGTRQGVAYNFNFVTGTLSLTNPAPIEVYIDLLNDVTFASWATPINNQPIRRVEFVINGDTTINDYVDIIFNDGAANTTPTLTGGPYVYNAIENSSAGTYVATITASDPENQILDYRFVESGLPFKITATPDLSTGMLTGFITVNGVLDFETKSVYTFNVRVRDAQGASATAPVTVNILDANDAPTVTLSPTSYNATVSVPVTFTVAVDDQDSTSLGIKLANAPVGATIDPISGEFNWTPGAANAGQTYIFEVHVSDGNSTTAIQVTIVVGAVAIPATLNIPTTSVNHASEPVVVASDLVLTGFTSNIDAARVTLGDGFVSASDRLQINGNTSGSINGISYNYNTVTGIMSLNNAASAATYESVLRQVTYYSTNWAISGTRDVTFSVGSQLANPDNGHYYEFVTASFINWTIARDAAAARNYFGLQGYLVTVTSAAENSFVAGKLQGEGWMGGNDTETEGVWKWVTGPEAGTIFCDGPTGNCEAVNDSYHNWAMGEPNDAQSVGGEDYLHYLTNGKWNDYPISLSNIAGYVVEYGGMAGDPTIQMSDTVTVNLLPNNAPTVNDQGFSIAENSTNNTAVGSVIASDPENHMLSYALSGSSPFSINASTGQITVSGPLNFEGTSSYNLTVTVTDEGDASDTATIMITITNVNDAPVISLNPTMYNSIEHVAVTFDVNATDEDGDTVTFGLTGAPADSTINPTTGEFSWTPGENNGGNLYNFDVTASDGTATPTIAIVINVNEANDHAPVFGTVTINPNPVNEGSAVTVTPSVTDGDGTTGLVYSLSPNAPVGASIDTATGVVTWTTSEEHGGNSYTFDIIVSDGTNLPVTHTVTIEVTEINHGGPVFDDVTVNPDPASEGTPVTVTPTVSDPDGTSGLTYSLDPANIPTGMTINPATGVVSWTPGEGDGGTQVVITIIVNDGVNGPVTQQVTINVNEVNDGAPVFDEVEVIPSPVDEGTPVTVTPEVTDPDGPGGLTFEIGPGAPGGVVIDPVTGVVTWTPGEGDGGTVVIIPIIVSDGVNPPVIVNVEIPVNEVNNGTPTLSAINYDGNVAEGQFVTFTAAGADIDLPLSLAYSVTNAPAGATFNTATGVFSWTPAEDQGGLSFTFDVVVSDGSLNSAPQTVTYTVAEVQSNPVLAAIGTRNIAKLESLSFTASATDSDLPVQALTYSLDAGSVSAATIDAATGAFNWATDINILPGVYPMTVTVTDSNGNSDSETFDVVVGFTANLLINGSFEDAHELGAKRAAAWDGIRNKGDRRKCPANANNIAEGNCVFRFRPSLTEFSRIKQKVDLRLEGLEAGDVLTLRGQFKAPQKPKLRMRLIIIYADGTRERLNVRVKRAKNYREYTITAPLRSVPVRAKVLIANRSANTNVFIDDLWLTAAPAANR